MNLFEIGEVFLHRPEQNFFWFRTTITGDGNHKVILLRQNFNRVFLAKGSDEFHGFGVVGTEARVIRIFGGG